MKKGLKEVSNISGSSREDSSLMVVSLAPYSREVPAGAESSKSNSYQQTPIREQEEHASNY